MPMKNSLQRKQMGNTYETSSRKNFYSSFDNVRLVYRFIHNSSYMKEIITKALKESDGRNL